MKITERELADLIGRRDDDHPDAETLARLLESDLAAEERESLMLHLEQCRSCASAVAVAMADTPARKPSARAWLSMAAGFAVLALALTFFMQAPDNTDLDVLRNSGLQVEPGHRITLDNPPEQFQWSSVASVEPLRVRLMDAAANSMWTSDLVTENQVAAPVSDLSAPGTYLWQIENREGSVVAGPFWFELK